MSYMNIIRKKKFIKGEDLNLNSQFVIRALLNAIITDNEDGFKNAMNKYSEIITPAALLQESIIDGESNVEGQIKFIESSSTNGESALLIAAIDSKNDVYLKSIIELMYEKDELDLNNLYNPYYYLLNSRNSVLRILNIDFEDELKDYLLVQSLLYSMKNNRFRGLEYKKILDIYEDVFEDEQSLSLISSEIEKLRVNSSFFNGFLSSNAFAGQVSIKKSLNLISKLSDKAKVSLLYMMEVNEIRKTLELFQDMNFMDEDKVIKTVVSGSNRIDSKLYDILLKDNKEVYVRAKKDPVLKGTLVKYMLKSSEQEEIDMHIININMEIDGALGFDNVEDKKDRRRKI